MMREEFTILEATKLLGQVYEAVQGFPAVPQGTKGRVVAIRIDLAAPVVEWELPGKHGNDAMGFLTKNMLEHLRPIEVEDRTATESFTESEAHDLVGQVFESDVYFSNVYKGMRGKIIDARKRQDGSVVIVVKWDLPNRTEPLISWFTKSEIRRFGRIAPA